MQCDHKLIDGRQNDTNFTLTNQVTIPFFKHVSSALSPRRTYHDDRSAEFLLAPSSIDVFSFFLLFDNQVSQLDGTGK